jgi:Methylase of chemotaxis methyl-accepting proteins
MKRRFFVTNRLLIWLAEDIRAHLDATDDVLKYKMWSVSCATGEEAYSLGLVAHHICQQSDKTCYYGVTATDVSSPAIALAKQGIYGIDKKSQINAQYLPYLKGLNKEMFTLSAKIKRRMAFGVFNLLDVKRPSQVKYDLIYCQHVLMYFERDVRRQILDGLVTHLNRGGLLILGQTEINAWSHPTMQRVEKGRTLAFRLI